MFTLAHLSDPHLGPLPRPRYRELVSKRIIGFANWHSNRARKYQPHILIDLVEAIRKLSPDHIAVTGDLVNIALPQEMVAAREWLESLGSPDAVTVVPGNHDAYVPGALARIRHAWLPFITGDADAEHGLHFPFVRRRGPAAIVGTSSARASAPMMATGHMKDDQLREMAATLKQLGEEGLFRVVLIHHPPVHHAADFHKRLVGAARFRAAIRKAGAELILHGHNHTRSVDYVDGPHRSRVPVVGVPSASNSPGGRLHPGAAFNLFRVEPKADGFACHMQEYGFTEVGAPLRLIAERTLGA